ncbi:MAG: hypothetical protein KF825_10540 [Ferruginibacter sp.]|nr:hypothetical protein [Ferruginibacter sp.]
MKIIYPILFFLSTLVLLFLAFYLLKSIDAGFGALPIILLISGIILSISFLAFFILRYLKTPSEKES